MTSSRSFLVFLVVAASIIAYAVENPIGGRVEKPVQSAPISTSGTESNLNEPIKSLEVESPPSAPSKSPYESPVLAALVGAIVALVGGLIGHLVTLRLASSRNEHEERLRSLEIAAGFREKVYLEAADAVAWALNNFMKLLSGDPQKYFEAMQEPRLGIAINKVNLIASDKTLDALTAFGSNYAVSTLELSAASYRVFLIAQRIQSLGKEIEETVENQRMLNAGWDNTPIPERSPARLDEYSRRFEHERSRLAKLFEDQKRELRRSDQGRHELVKMGMGHVKTLSGYLAEASLAIRTELNFPCDPAAYKGRILSTFQVTEAALEKFSDDLKRANAEEILR